MESAEILSQIITLSNSTIEIEERLLAIIHCLSESFSVDACSIYTLEPDSDVLNLYISSVPREEVSKNAFYSIGDGIVGICALKREPIIIENSLHLDDEQKNVIKTMDQWGAFFAQPITDGDNLYGVLLMQNRNPVVFDEEEVRLLSVIAREIAGNIRNARLYYKAKKRVEELTALFEISKAVNSTADLDRLIDIIVKTSVQVIGARGGILQLINEESQELIPRSKYGWEPFPHQKISIKDRATASCHVVQTGAPMIIKDTRQEYVCCDLLREEVHSYVCVPLQFKDRFLGILSVFDKEASGIDSMRSFKEDDLNLLSTMASYISNALEQALTLKKVENLIKEKEEMVRELSILHGTSIALMGARKLDKVLRILLSAITFGDGLGFNRAMLFLVNEKNHTLDGMMAVGPENREEALRIWAALSNENRSLYEWLMSEEMDHEVVSKIDMVIKNIHIPIDDTRCLLTKCLCTRDIYRMKEGKALYGTDLFRDIEIADEFAVVPIVSKGKSLGVILVDNIYTKKEISQEDIRFLQAFASHAAIAIENTILNQNLQIANDELRRMQEKLIHSERLAALGEFSTSLAHELRNPLVTIGGYARRLEKECNNRYANIILKEVNRLEDLLKDILTFSRIDRDNFVDADLNKIIEDCIFSLSKEINEQKIEVVREFTSDLPYISCDIDQIRQAFLNLITNSIQAMKGGGILTIRTYLSCERDQVHIVSEVEDTGCGIPIEIMHNIFNPFFTTKDFGTGLGLAITHRIISNHHGTIEVKNIPGSGCCFIVKIPVRDL